MTLPAPVLTDVQLARLESRRIFFGHQSVGANIIAGVQEILATDTALKLRIVHSAAPATVAGPAFIEAPVGRNGDPRSKTAAFTAMLDDGIGREGGIVLHKYCYVDFDASTDVKALFEAYRADIARLHVEHPELTIVHVTTPLTVAGSFRADLLARVRRRPTATAANARRSEFNALLRHTYEGREPIFDLAAIESTHHDGARSYDIVGGDTVYSLAREYTSDGGHLNALGRRIAASRLLELLATL